VRVYRPIAPVTLTNTGPVNVAHRHFQAQTQRVSVALVRESESRALRKTFDLGILLRMDNIQDQIRELQTSVRRQRFAIVALASVSVGAALIGAARPTGDVVFDKITCKSWSVVDVDGKERIAARTKAHGEAGIEWFETGGRMRMEAGIKPDETAWLCLLDKEGNWRLTTSTYFDGTPHVHLSTGKAGSRSIRAGMDRDGAALLQWFEGTNIPLRLGTTAEGGIIYPTKDGK
jgi:hypothetical protein